MADRFRGFMPVVVDVETGGLNAQTDALLELAAVLLELDDNGKREINEPFHRKPLSNCAKSSYPPLSISRPKVIRPSK